MSPSMIFSGIGMFAVATVIITIWGMRKSYYQKDKLTNMLLSKASGKVMKYLKEHDTISEKEIRKITEGLQVGEFGSKARAVVDGNHAFAKNLIDSMLHDGLIELAGYEKGRPKYKRIRK